MCAFWSTHLFYQIDVIRCKLLCTLHIFIRCVRVTHSDLLLGILLQSVTGKFVVYTCKLLTSHCLSFDTTHKHSHTYTYSLVVQGLPVSHALFCPNVAYTDNSSSSGELNIHCSNIELITANFPFLQLSVFSSYLSFSQIKHMSLSLVIVSSSVATTMSHCGRVLLPPPLMSSLALMRLLDG